MSLDNPLSYALPIDSDDQSKTPNIESLWYRSDVGSRLKPAIQAVFENWSGITGDELTHHLHHVVCSVPSLTSSSNLALVQFTSATRRGSIFGIPVSENGSSFCRSYHK